MKLLHVAVSVVLLAAVARAERAVSIGEYAEEVRSRVVAKIHEALETDDGGVAEVSGTVTFAGKGCFFLQRDNDGLKIFSAGRLPSAGDVVTASGTPSLEGGRVVFLSKSWTRTGTAPLPQPRQVALDDILSSDGGRAVNWLRVSLAGRVIGVTDNGFAIRVENIPVNVMTGARPDFLSDADITHPRLIVRGVVDFMLDQSALTDRAGETIGVRLYANSGEDIALVSDAGYVARKNARLVTIVLLSLAGALVAAVALFALLFVRQRKRLFKSRTIMEERRRMADDLHDTIEQHLVGAGMMLKLGRIKEAQDALVRAKSETRDVVWGLKNDDMMRMTPADMLRKLAHDETVKGLCRVDTKLAGLPQRLDAAQMRDLSLIVREAVANAVKHGGARKVAISADQAVDGGWTLRIANDGAAFDPGAAPGAADGHFGLEGMRRRALRLGADVSIAPRKGWMVVELAARGKPRRGQ